ncbi:F-box/LRR-repeat protein 4 isoform X1 [Bacillus rossius redtenbacheri]|uniref:F-box/LRR-repeat protein 4 isoform X1 n=1 Tax=Bacillus rossius redtenbacheri TaxID=93214 RepID=UPI002FDD5A73
MEKCVFIEQFVQEVRSYSSQYGSDFSISYTAYNITGRPSKFPDYGDFPQTFVMRTYGRWWDEAPSRSEVYMPQTCGDIASQDYIELEFEQAVFPSRVHVYEIYNPGAVVRVWASDGDRWARLWEGGPQVVGHVPRIFSPDIARVHFPAKLLRLEFSHRHLDYYTEIDAVLLAGSKRAPARGGGSGGGCDQASVGSLASHILDLNIHSIPAQVDIPSSIEKFLANDLPQLLKEAEIATQLVAPVASEKPGCGFDLLPNEIIFKIFGYLDLKSLCRCCQVDKRFQNLACDYQLYTEVNLKVYWFCATGRTLSALAPRCRLLRKLDLSWCGSLRSVTADHFARFIGDCGCQLTHLRLNCCKFVNNASMVLIAEKWKNLKELAVQNCNDITDSGFFSLSTLKGLERLDLYHTLITVEPLKAIIMASPCLKHINLGSCSKIANMDEVARALGAHCAGLVSVDVWKTCSLTPAGVRALAGCSRLQEVDLGWCLGVNAPDDCLVALAHGCPRLRKLFLAALKSVGDRDLEPFVRLCPGLEQVDLLGMRNISSGLCLQFLSRLPRLRLLDVSFCDQIQDAEVACWRSFFPHVSIKCSFQHEGPSPPPSPS